MMHQHSNGTWCEYTLSDLFHVKHGFAFDGKYFTSSGEYVLLTPGNFYDEGGFKHKEQEKYYVGEVDEQYVLAPGDLIVAMTEQAEGLLGSSALIPTNEKYLHNQRLGLIVHMKADRIDKRFLYYLFNTSHVRSQIRASASGTKVRHTSPTRIGEVKVRIPRVNTQRKIASILAAYDDLIENNTRRIAILEEMAQALYREWFVRFRFPGHENLPLVPSPLGDIPQGWEVVPLKSVYRTSSGGTPSRKIPEYFENGTINWVKTKELDDRFLWETEERITDLGLENSSARVFPSRTVIMAMYGATIGKLGILGSEAATNQACCAFMTNESKYSYPYLFLNLLSNRHEIIRLRAGAAQQNVSQDVIREMPLLKPPLQLVQRFNQVSESFLDGLQNLQRKNSALRKTRDLLLPKLISGQLDVEHLDIDVGEPVTV